MRTDKDYYRLLGVRRDADDRTIRDAYRRLARKYHPDVNPNDPQAAEKFKEVGEAYNCLRDPEKRRLYDQFGPHWQQAQRAGQAGGFQWQSQGFGGGGFSDIFDQFFGRGFGAARDFRTGPFDEEFSTQTRPRSERGPDTEQELVIPLEEAIYGRTRSLTVTIKETCPDCNGNGNLGGRRCTRCHATGRALRRQQFQVKVPPGVKTGSKIRLQGQGGKGPHGGPPGDLFFVVKVQDHPLFRREGDDLYCDLPLTVAEATLGTTVTVPTREGDVTLTIPPGTHGGKKLRLPGLGVPHLNGGGAGDLYFVVRIRVPTNLDDTGKELVQGLTAYDPDNPRRGMRGKFHRRS